MATERDIYQLVERAAIEHVCSIEDVWRFVRDFGMRGGPRGYPEIALAIATYARYRDVGYIHEIASGRVIQPLDSPFDPLIPMPKTKEKAIKPKVPKTRMIRND